MIRRRGVRGWLGAAGALWILGTATMSARAEPAFAVRTGYRCSQCHVNRTGGGLRTSFGSIWSQTVLPARLLHRRDGRNLIPANPDARFAFGADVRFQYLAVALENGEDTSSFEIPEANLYAEVRLAPRRLSLYVDQKVGPSGSSSRELFGLLSFRKLRAYLKLGKFLPPYGWRLPDDDAFIRSFSGFTYINPDTGLEFGLEPGRWSFHLSAVNGAGGGSDDNRTKKLTMLTVRRFDNWRIGISGANNRTGGVTTAQAGLLAGANFGRLALLAEGDWVETRDAGSTERLIGLIEADLLVSRGLSIKLARDWIDPDRDVSTDARIRDSVGLEYVPYPFVQLRWFARFRDGPPQIPGAREAQVELEAHFFF